MQKRQPKIRVQSRRRGVSKSTVVGAHRVAKKSVTARLAGRSRAGVKPSGVVRGTALCPQCGAVYYDKHWHSSMPPQLRRRDLPAKTCETCRSGSSYAGEVVIEGVADAGERAQIAALARNVGKRAQDRDPEERIVHLHDDGVTLRIFTSENQLAVSIGKQVDRSRKGGRLEIVWSKDDMTARVHWHAPEK